MALILFMVALPGTREEKTEFFHRMFERLHAKRNARLKALRTAYMVWRQRKCWMWGGGFRRCVLAILPDVFDGAKDEKKPLDADNVLHYIKNSLCMGAQNPTQFSQK